MPRRGSPPRPLADVCAIRMATGIGDILQNRNSQVAVRWFTCNSEGAGISPSPCAVCAHPRLTAQGRPRAPNTHWPGCFLDAIRGFYLQMRVTVTTHTTRTMRITAISFFLSFYHCLPVKFHEHIRMASLNQRSRPAAPMDFFIASAPAFTAAWS